MLVLTRILEGIRDANRWPSFVWKLCIGLLVATLAYLFWGYSFGVLTNEYHATIILKIVDPSLFKGDFLSSTLDGYASPLWHAVSWFARWIPIETLFFVGFFGGRVLFAWAVGSLAACWTTDPRRRAVSWCVGAFSTLGMGWILGLPVGGDGVLGPYFSQTFLSVAVLLLAMSKAVRGEYLLSSALLGLGFNFNIMQSLLAGGCIVGFWMLDPHRATLQVRYRSLLLSGSVTCLVSLPALVMTVQSVLSNFGDDFLSGSALGDWARFWLAGHFYLDDRSPIQLVSMIACLALPVVLGLRVISTHRWNQSLPLAVPAFLAVLHLGLVYQFPLRILFQLHLLRSDVFAYSTSVTLAIAHLVNARWRSGRHAGMAGAILGLLLVGALIQAAVAALILFAIPRERSSRLGTGAWIMVLLGMGCVGWSLVLALPTAGLMLTAGLVHALLPENANRRWVTVLVVGACLFLTARASRIFFAATWRQHSPAVAFGEDSPHSIQLCAFGRSTPVDAVFLLPPTVNARAFLRRSVWFNFYDGAAFLWRKGAGPEVDRRMHVLGIKYEPGELVNLDSMYFQWKAGLCSSIPLVETEGVTHVVLPDPEDRWAPWTLHTPASAMEALGCGSSALQEGEIDTVSH